MRTGIWHRLLAFIALAALSIPLAVVQPIAGDGDEDQYGILQKRELRYPNLGSHLDQLVASVEAGEASAEEAAEDTAIHQDESVAVTIHLSGHAADVAQFLEDNGGDPRNVGEDYIEAYVPVTLLGPVSEQPGVIRVREIVPPQPVQTSQLVTGHGPLAHGSAVWNQAGYSGKSVKVGIIDIGFKDLTSLMGTELPVRIHGRCYTDIGVFTQNLADCEAVGEVTVGIPECLDAVQRSAIRSAIHGTIVAESVIDIAPEVSLYIANPGSRADLQDAAEWMASQGVAVINHSVGWGLDGPGDGTSPNSASPLNTVDRAVASNILWVNAAGNSAQETWFGGYSDPDGDGIISFGSQNDEVLDIPVRACRRYVVQLRWEDNWDGASTDLDLYLYNTETRAFVFSSRGEQTGDSGQVPSEWLWFRSRIDTEALGIVVDHYGGDVPDWIQLLVWAVDPIHHHTGNGSITNPAESANPGMLAVGAAPWYDVHTIEPYSSRGPTPDGRVKPDVVGADCGETAFRPLNESRRGFCGTSQAAPHVAGLAALVRQRFPEKTPVEVAEYLKGHAERRGLVPNNTWGYGFAQLPAHDAVPSTPTTVTLSQDTVLANQTLSISGSGFSDSAAGSNRCIEQGNVLINNVPVEIIDLADSGDCNGSVELTSSGTFALTVVLRREDGTIPDLLLTAGTHSVVITDTKGVEGRSQVTIPARELEATPNPARPQDQITIRGRNFPADNPGGSNVAVDITYDCGGLVRRTVSGEPDAAGNFEETLPVPNDCGVPSTNTIRVSTSVDGIETVVDTITHDVLPSADTCGETITSDGAVNGQWAEGCQSEVPGRGYARYYTFTLAQESEVTITLDSEDADTYLYLRQGEARSGTALYENDDDGGITRSKIQETLTAGTYTIEATTYGEEEAGSFTLAISGLRATVPPPGPTPSDPCGETLTGNGTVSGRWAAGCQSEVSGRGYARYYTFTLESESEVTITLESQDADTYLYLRQGEARSGTALYENDDDGGTTKSRVQETLAAGTYTIEATTYDEGETGSFTLTVSGLGAVPAAQSCSVGLTLAPGERCSHQDFTMEVDASGTLLMRFTGNRVDLDNLALVRSGNRWSIESLP